MSNKENSVRIQTSILNPLEKKVLIWIAERLPKWVTSDMLTWFSLFGALVIAAVASNLQNGASVVNTTLGCIQIRSKPSSYPV